MSLVSKGIRRMRLDAGLSQGQLAERLGVSRPTLSKWETGWPQPPMWVLTKLAAELGVKPEDIVSEGGLEDSMPRGRLANLKAIRKATGRTQKDAARESGVPYPTYIAWEQLVSTPHGSDLVKLADYFGCTIDSIFGRTTLEDRLAALEARLAAVEDWMAGKGDASSARTTDREIVARIRGLLSGTTISPERGAS